MCERAMVNGCLYIITAGDGDVGRAVRPLQYCRDWAEQGRAEAKDGQKSGTEPVTETAGQAKRS